MYADTSIGPISGSRLRQRSALGVASRSAIPASRSGWFAAL